MSGEFGPRLLKGALVQLATDFLGPVPNVIVFQYNPETLQRKLTPWNPPASEQSDAKKGGSADDTQPFDPVEQLTLALEFDAADDLEHPDQNPVAVVSGVAARIAAIEELLYPVPPEQLNASTLLSLAGLSGPAPTRSAVPIVLFVWGPGRILPVRISDFSVDEQLFSPTLFPVRAKVSLTLQVYGPAWFDQRRNAQNGKLTPIEVLAEAAYKYTRGQSGVLARLNTAGMAVDSILALLPF
jgi:hypothetical protein